jgi:hypothetical protein
VNSIEMQCVAHRLEGSDKMMNVRLLQLVVMGSMVLHVLSCVLSVQWSDFQRDQ